MKGTSEIVQTAVSMGLDPDVFFCDNEGPIVPEMCSDFLAFHQEVICRDDVKYSNETGAYHLNIEIPEELHDVVTDNIDIVQEVFSGLHNTSVLTSPTGVYIIATSLNPIIVGTIVEIVEQNMMLLFRG